MKKREHKAIIKQSFINAKLSGLKLNVIVISNGCCPECLKINGKEIPFKEAEKSPPIPHPKCTREWGCNCTIGFLPIRDDNDKLIREKYQ